MFTIKFGNKTFSRISVGTSSLGKISKRVNIIKPIISTTQSNNNVIGPTVSNSLYDGNTQWDDSKVWDDSVTINFN
jgi:hypothetical protein